MTSLLAKLGEWLGMTRKLPETQLSVEQAVQIATDYAKAEGLNNGAAELVLSRIEEAEGKVVWTLRTNTIGRWLTVGVDDATGAVLGHRVHGVR